MAGKSLKNEKEEEPLICKSIQYELAIFFAHYPPKVFNRNLRDLIVDYLTNDPDPSHYDMETAMQGVWRLMKVLDKAEDGLKPKTFSEISLIAKKGGHIAKMDND